MAVEMVRKPSETPNIENVDDFMPIRYAYANQNGYVLGYGGIGTGLDTNAYSINGNYFIINSGRLVLQGVETDVKNEHTIVIDINATKRYYAVYLQVNLATNTSEILINYDTAGIPSIDIGDDLTINSVGTARMVLFTFEATNGIISNVVKVVKACEYSIPFRLDENGVLKVKDIIIPQRKILWYDKNGATSADLSEELKVGDKIEVTYSLWLNRQTVKGEIYQLSPSSQSTNLFVRADFLVYNNPYYQTATISINTQKASISQVGTNYESPTEPKIYQVVKVIE